MDLTTSYLGLKLPHPFMAGASPFSREPESVRKLEDCGASAVVLPSLFEEEIDKEKQATINEMEAGTEMFGEALSYLPEPKSLTLGADTYLEKIRKTKEAVSIPVIGSLNGYTDSGWIDYAKKLEEAGVDAIELNVYFAPTALDVTGASIERKLIDIAAKTTKAVNVPVSVKLSPTFSSVANVCAKLVDEAGVAGLVLFNRFFQPDIELEKLEVEPALSLSTSTELPQRLAWVGALAGRTNASLAITGGVHDVEDAVKSVMVGADAIQVVSCLFNNGPEYLGDLRDGLAKWIEAHDYESLSQMKGCMSLMRCPDPESYSRLNYARLLKGWQDTEV